MDLRATKKAATRIALTNAALLLFERDGFAETTMDDIAAAAGVSRPTAFRHFPVKADLVLGVQDEWLRIFAEGTAARSADESWWDTLTRTSGEIADHIRGERARVVRAFRLAMSEPALQGRAAERDREWVTLIALLVRPETDDFTANVVSGAVMGMITSVLAAWAERGGRADLRSLLERGFVLLRDGLSPARPLKPRRHVPKLRSRAGTRTVS